MLTQSSTSIDPITTTESIKESYLHFLTSTFSLRNPELSERFKKKIEESSLLFKGPILQATPHYRSGKSLRELSQESDSGVSAELLNYIPAQTQAAHQQALNFDRPLYSHQQQSLKQVAQGQNVVVATGTGSGKTESFLYPILNRLIQEREAANGKLTPGVRALLIYPMNALANDQMKRLRELVPPETGIRFGRYTGQTRPKTEDALNDFKQEHNANPPANEAISREQIQQSPPHILVTNYAMLEYLLIRPEDSILFQHDTWQFLVLDEAHTYKGALGTEIGYLMRKLQQRVSPDRRLQCIATSATIGDDKDPEVKQTIAEAVSVLFGQPFQVDNLIFADKIPVKERLIGESWGEGSEAFYQFAYDFFQESTRLAASALPQAIETFFDNLNSYANKSSPGFPSIETIENAWLQSTELNIDVQLSQFLYLILEGDLRVRKLTQCVESQPQELQSLYTQIFETSALEIEETLPLVQLIRLSTFAKDYIQRIPLLMARYHFFVRSIEGLSVSFPAENEVELHIGHHAHVITNAVDISAFELKGCKRCGYTFLHGEIIHDTVTDKRKFVSFPEKKRLNENHNLIHLCIDLEEAIEPSPDADVFIESDSHEDKGQRTAKDFTSSNLSPPKHLCLHCGQYGKDLEYCCSNPRLQSVREVHPADERSFLIKTCPACGGQKRNGIIHSFRNDENEGAFALGMSLFANIPSTCENSSMNALSPTVILDDDDEDGFFTEYQNENDSSKLKVPQGKKRLLAFSDSRRDAAFFAAYMQRQSEKLLHRQLIYQAVSLHQKNKSDKQVSIAEILETALDLAFKKGLFAHKSEGKKRAVANWIYAEICSIQSRKSLEGAGLLHWHLHPDVRQEIIYFFEKNPTFLQKLKLSQTEGLALLEIFIHYLRQNSVVKLIEPMRTYINAYFWPKERPYSINLNVSDSTKSISAWTTQSTRQNVRTAFLKKLSESKKSDFSQSQTDTLMKNFWSILTKVPVLENSKMLIMSELKTLWESSYAEGSAWQLNPNIFVASLTPPPDSEVYGWYRCNDCRQIRGVNLHGLCPTYRCKGQLEAIVPEQEFKGHYYHRLYKQEHTEVINIREHTAQISAKEGAEIQQQFIDDTKDLNMLSCSTTFELGVDVGQLHAVYLRNVPPGIANYVQRAGRAARRLDATAFILTFCRARSHDLSWFKDAEAMVSGEVEPPRIPVNNIEIARRHLHSIVLAQFFKAYPEFYTGPENKHKGKLKWLFFSGESLAEKLWGWLEKSPESLKQTLINTFDQVMAQELGLHTWNWVAQFLSPNHENDAEISERSKWSGALGRAQEEIMLEYESYGTIREQAKENDQDYLKRGATKQQERIIKTSILNYLPARGVLPKYGFPTDVVSLRVLGAHDATEALRLDRDLRMAISEFAPGSALIANGKVYKSYALQTIPHKTWPEYYFYTCKECGYFQMAVNSEDIKTCPCGQSVGNKFQRFVIPSFGFTTYINAPEQDPVDVPPSRTYTSQVYFSDYEQAKTLHFVPEGDQSYVKQLALSHSYRSDGKLVVLNTNSSQGLFNICKSCGYGTTEKNDDSQHIAPWGKPCNTYLSARALGHEFKTDVLEICLSGEQLDLKLEQDVWWSVLFAMVRGACRALGIEEDNLGGTLKQFSGGSTRSLILYDTFPAGAGFVKNVAHNLKLVIEAALRILEECNNCSEEQSCQECLQTYQNQFVHSILKRGPAARLLRKYHSLLYHQDYDGYTPPLGTQVFKLWFEQRLNQVQQVSLVLPDLSKENIRLFRENWVLHLLRSAANGCQITLLMNHSIDQIRQYEMVDSLPVVHLLQHKNIKSKVYFSKPPTDLKLVLQRGNETYLVKSDSDLFDLSPDAKPDFVIKNLIGNAAKQNKELIDFNNWKNDLNIISAQDLQEQFQDTEYISLRRAHHTNWSELLLNKLPSGIMSVEIYDRYLRRSRVVESLSDFLKMLNQYAEQQKQSISLELSTSFGSRLNEEGRNPHSEEAIRAQQEKKYQEENLFPMLRKELSEQGVFSHLRINESGLKTQHKERTTEHQRYVRFNTVHNSMDLKLEKGFDILVPKNDGFYISDDSYLVLVHKK